MWVYIINLILIILLYIIFFKIYKTNNSKKYFCILVFVLFSLIQGLRGNTVGNDTSNYIKFFELSKNMSFTDIFLMRHWVIEPGYGLLMKICSIIHFSPQMFLLVVAIIINGGLMYFIYKNSDNPFISVIIFMGVEFFTLSFTALRQMIAVILILNSYKFIKQQKIVKFILMVLLAASFHKSALIFLPIYFLKDLKINAKNFYIGIAIFILAQVFIEPIINYITKKIYYESYIKSDGGGITQTIVILIYLLLGIIIYKKSNQKQKCIDETLFVIIYLAFFIQSLAYKINMINRLMWYFYIFIIVFLPNLTKCVDKVKKIKDKEINLRNVYDGVILLLSTMQYLVLSIDMYNVVPYRFLNL